MTGHRTAPRRRGENLVSSLGRQSANGRAAGSTGTSGRGLPTKKSNISICAPTRHSFCSSRIICPNFITAPCVPLLTLSPCLSARDRGTSLPQAEPGLHLVRFPPPLKSKSRYHITHPFRSRILKGGARAVMAQTRSIASPGGATVAMARARLVPIAPCENSL